MPFDEKLDPDIQSVLNAAAILDVTEFDLFRLAYARWFGESVEDSKLEPHFVAYMFRDVVPVWVRDFARRVERLFRRGRLDPEALGVERLVGSPQMVARGVRYAVIIGMVLVALIVLADFLATLLDVADRCLFPPCY